ncbi:PREDICTED: light-harvesting complex-like protein 3 isotype 2, chloroplastic [Nicotiana attenuata]|uniref:light-harvesting complex-like protein 3 isotype 2, chloroplastic n=1 Tax=Nicotiana attenuata TaxID=49451 RepID=UPI000904720E|nr:PREDICTED: light-harvesting complex-like protein 3 isotype 2, chloroplastic [Nicotiana attenuata]
MLSSMALFSAPPPHFPTLSPPKPHLTHKLYTPLTFKKPHFSFRAVDDVSSGITSTSAVIIEQEKTEESNGVALNSNGSPPAVSGGAPVAEVGVRKFQDSRWVGRTWDLKQFEKDGKIHWDSVIDAGDSLYLQFVFFFLKLI